MNEIYNHQEIETQAQSNWEKNLIFKVMRHSMLLILEE